MTEAQEKGKRLAPEEVSLFCEQVTLILKSGIPLFDGMETLCANYRETRYAQIFAGIHRAVKETGALHPALEAAGVFPVYMVRMARIGETAGKLDDVMDGLGRYYAREAKIRTAVKNAVAYPAAMALMMAVVIGVLISQVLPIFDRVFRNLGSEMNASMTAVMNFGSIAGNVAMILVGLLLLTLAIGFVLLRMGKRQFVTRLVRRLLPPVRKVMEKTSSARFASVLSMMMSAGFPISDAVSMAANVITDQGMLEKAARCAKAIGEGADLTKAIAEAELFDPLYSKMIQVGFQAGQMDRVMERLSDLYEEEVDDGIRRLVGVIEPSFVAVLAVIIGGILLAVMLPLASIMSSVL